MQWDEQIEASEGSKKNEEDPSRIISYPGAINEALEIILSQNPKSIILGQGVDDPHAMFGATRGLVEKFGSKRILDTPVCEDAMTGFCVGAALSGVRPILMHNRPDFLLLTFNQIVNHAAKFYYMSHGQTKVPMIIWSAIGHGWGSGAQHSQAIQGLLMGVPGLKILMPHSPYDAKGLLLAAAEDNNPTIIFEHRLLMKKSGFVPKGYYKIPIGQAELLREGRDLTLIACSQSVDIALAAAEDFFKESKYEIEVINLRSIQPFDENMILKSVKKTGQAIVADTGWVKGGVSAEISAFLSERAFSFLKAPIKRFGFPDCPTPSGHVLEKAYYPNLVKLKKLIYEFMENKK